MKELWISPRRRDEDLPLKGSPLEVSKLEAERLLLLFEFFKVVIPFAVKQLSVDVKRCFH